jgi:hypothetical protein
MLGAFSWRRSRSEGRCAWPSPSVFWPSTGWPLRPMTCTCAPATGLPVWIDCTNTSWLPSPASFERMPRSDTSTRRESISPMVCFVSGLQLSTLTKNRPRRAPALLSRYLPRSKVSYTGLPGGAVTARVSTSISAKCSCVMGYCRLGFENEPLLKVNTWWIWSESTRATSKRRPGTSRTNTETLRCPLSASRDPLCSIFT